MGTAIDNYIQKVTEEVKSHIQNDFNLNIPRYVDTYEEEPEIDLAATQIRITELEEELADVKTEMDKYLQFFN